ncbi:hypothetical protein RND71_025806 [Anisodus tanguticus]|uniref:Uncharacterized protein n=1 Tax=Anisodus tanguticus TaxID=243964 RepID=A0AAE1RMR2_9SOLA|nr:hypothetical protein RND71_025806 [Anisodus tanguticus]
MPLEYKNLVSLRDPSKESLLPPRLNTLIDDKVGSKQPGTDKGSVLPNSSIGDNS